MDQKRNSILSRICLQTVCAAIATVIGSTLCQPAFAQPAPYGGDPESERKAQEVDARTKDVQEATHNMVDAFSKRDFDATIVHCDRILGISPRHQGAHYYKASALHRLNRLEDAKKEFAEAQKGSNKAIAKNAATAIYALEQQLKPKPDHPPEVKKDPPKAVETKTPPPVAAKIEPRPTIMMFLNFNRDSVELGPPLIQIEKKYGSQIEIKRMRGEDNRTLPYLEKYQVPDYPCAIFLDRDGKEVDRMIQFDDAYLIFCEKLDKILKK